MPVGLPLTGSGESTATVATELISTQHYQLMKLIDGAGASTAPIIALATTPGDTVSGMVVRVVQGMVNQGTFASSTGPWWMRETNPTTSVNVANPTTAVTVSSGVILGPSTAAIGLITSGTQTIGTVQNATSTGIHGAVSLATAGTTATLGQFAISNPATAVTVSSGVILAAGSSANTIGSVALVAGTSANSIGSVAIVAGSSANILGAVAQGPASTGSGWWYMGTIPFTSANVSRSSVATTVDIQIVAANTARKGMIIASRSTVQTVGIGFSTAAVTTALANVDLYLPPSQYLTFGMPGGLPLHTGPMRGINLTSTSVAGSVAVIQFA